MILFNILVGALFLLALEHAKLSIKMMSSLLTLLLITVFFSFFLIYGFLRTSKKIKHLKEIGLKKKFRVIKINEINTYRWNFYYFYTLQVQSLDDPNLILGSHFYNCNLNFLNGKILTVYYDPSQPLNAKQSASYFVDPNSAEENI